MTIAIEPVLDKQHVEIQPYMRLWASVFHRGISDFCTARAAGKNDGRVFWFYDDRAHPGSFVWLCDLFRIAPDVARSAVLKKWRAYVDKVELKEQKKWPTTQTA